MAHHRQRRSALADQLAHAGYLDDLRWFDAFRAVPREAFVTTFAVPHRDGRLHRHDLTNPADADAALTAVYTDNSLLTQFDTGGTATSSSTAPSLMALMLHQLDVREGMTVLEVGTGTGYNAALLAHVLGDDAVTSIDFHPGLVTTARHALEASGYRPHVDVADGRDGYPARAPFDRLIATCGLDRVPPAWLRQVRPGGRILVNLSFALLLLTVADDGTATGRFGETAAFMAIRDDPADVATTATDVLATVTGHSEHPPRRAPWYDQLTTEPVAFLRALAMPALHAGRHPAHPRRARAAAGRTRHRLLGPGPPHPGRRRAGRARPRRLYDDLAALAVQWDQHGRPAPERYGLSVTTRGQHVLWLDDPSTLVTVL